MIMGKHKKKRDSATSSGKRKFARINRQMSRLRMKIKRWERYQKEIEQSERKASIKRWDTSGLKKHMELLESFI